MPCLGITLTLHVSIMYKPTCVSVVAEGQVKGQPLSQARLALPTVSYAC